MPEPTKDIIGDARLFSREYSNNKAFKKKDFLHSWRKEIGQYLDKNDNFCFACSIGFAGILLEPLRIDYGSVFHLVGQSSTGKTTIAKVLASMLGEPKNQIDNWNNTKNGLEAYAEEKNHNVLILDEIGQARIDELHFVAYDIPNGSGKGRMAQNISTRPKLQWLLYTVSTGERTLKEVLAQNKQKPMGGQLVRFIDIPVDAGAGYGALNYIPERFNNNPKLLIDHLNKSIKDNYGTVARAFTCFIAEKINLEDEAYFEDLKKRIKQLTQDWLPSDAQEQISRMAEAFAQVAIAGEEATEQGLTGWDAGDATRSAKQCFDSALGLRGGITENAEVTTCLENVRDRLQKDGNSCFAPLHGLKEDSGDEDLANKTANMLGYYRNDKSTNEKEFFVFPNILEDISQYNQKITAEILNKYGFLNTSSGRLQKQIKINGVLQRFYSIKQSILSYGN